LKTDTNFENIEPWVVDLAPFKSVRAIKKKINNLERLDVLVENAAVVKTKYVVTPDGWEETLQVNAISPAYHIILHIPKMLETAQKYPEVTPRIVMVSTDYHYRMTVPNEIIDGSNSLKALNEENFALTISSLLGDFDLRLLATFLPRIFQSRLPNSSPMITCCNVAPGFCYSDLRREIHADPEHQKLADRTREQEEKLAFTSEEGSRQLLYAAISQRDKEGELRGGYVSYNKVTECSDWVLSADGQRFEKKLWRDLVEVIEKVDAVAKAIVERYLS
ncbi:hypothetical protein L218DRAFT_871521, partial [Marasmius fiardii PR-910]